MTNTSGKQAAMTDAQFTALAKIVYDKSGIHFPVSKKYVLESRLERRLAELEIETYDQYIALLSIGPYQADEFQEMFNRITINETSFFRNEPQLEVFEKKTLVELVEARRDVKRLRIWSAACSSGEEPFTLAILVHRALGVRLMDWKIEIVGTDISEKALETARAAKYTEYAIRCTPGPVKGRYFRSDGAGPAGPVWSLDPAVRSMVSFDTLNLKDRLAARRLGRFDAIFCRNAMIYFDEAMKTQVVGMFADQLADDGTLFIGHSETLRGLEVPFEGFGPAQGFCYRKIKAEAKPAGGPAAAARPAPVNSPALKLGGR